MPLSGPPLEEPIDLRNLLARGLASKPDEVGLVSAEGGNTWRELDRASDRLAANMLELGVRRGDRVASLMPNRNALIIHYLACFKAGFVATPLNYRYMPPEIDHALEVSGATVLLAHAERDQDLAASKLAPRLPLGVIGYGAEHRRGPSFEELTRRAPRRPEIPPPSSSDPAVIFFTSGSTGKPKGVTHSFETVGWMFASAIRSFEMTPEDVMMSGASNSHIGGYVFSLMALAAGCRIVIARTFDADELLPLLRQDRPTVLWMLPAALITLVRDHAATRDDFASIRLCVSGGDKVPAELEREFTDLAGFPIDEIYGMSEIGTSNINPPSGVNKIGSIGKLGPGYRASIRDESGTELPTGAQGRLWISSPCNMIGYWSRPDATEETIKDGWLDTGDVMRADEDDYLWFCGRKKQIIIHDGSNICPQEVEEALLEHDAVAGAGVVGIHDLVHGENVRAYITLKDGAARPTSQELIRFARARVGYKAPEDIVVLEEMPLNATGKVDRVTLKRMAEEHLAGTPQS
jgi:long-chain acyl-CoA synthetase